MENLSVVENHPFAPFVPSGARYLLVGTFPGRALTQPGAALAPDDWYYGTHAHSLWHLLEEVYGQALPTAHAKQVLLTKLGMGVTDVVAAARRHKPTNNDSDLEVVAFQVEQLAELLTSHAFEQLYFTSQQAQKWFVRLRPQLLERGVPAGRLDVPRQRLPSPSPQYVRFGWDTVAGRLATYRQLLPPLA